MTVVVPYEVGQTVYVVEYTGENGINIKSFKIEVIEITNDGLVFYDNTYGKVSANKYTEAEVCASIEYAKDKALQKIQHEFKMNQLELQQTYERMKKYIERQ